MNIITYLTPKNICIAIAILATLIALLTYRSYKCEKIGKERLVFQVGLCLLVEYLALFPWW